MLNRMKGKSFIDIIDSSQCRKGESMLNASHDYSYVAQVTGGEQSRLL
jgi:hypothetical protein